MALTKVGRGLLNTSIVDNGNATAITIDASSNVTIGVTDATSKRLIFQGSGSVGYEGGINWQRDSAIDNSITVDSSESLSINFAQSDLASRALLFKSGSAFTERARLTSDGNLGIGTSSPNQLLTVADSSGGATVNISTDQTAGSSGSKKYMNLDFSGYANTVMARIQSWDESSSTGNGYLTFHTTPSGGSVTERMRIDASGNVLFNATSTSASQGSYFQAGRGSLLLKNSTTSPSHCLQFINPNGTVGQIYTNGSATYYNTSSDYRLKEDDVPMTGATERVKALRPINFAWKVDGSRTDGFFAHEAQEVVPECSTGTKDAMRDEEYEVTPAVEEVRDEDGNVTTEAIPAVMGTRSVPDYQGIDQSKLVPLLTATIQELIARIEALEGA